LAACILIFATASAILTSCVSATPWCGRLLALCLTTTAAGCPSRQRCPSSSASSSRTPISAEYPSLRTPSGTVYRLQVKPSRRWESADAHRISPGFRRHLHMKRALIVLLLATSLALSLWIYPRADIRTVQAQSGTGPLYCSREKIVLTRDARTGKVSGALEK